MEQEQQLGKGGAAFMLCFCAFVSWTMFKLQTIIHNVFGALFAIAAVYFLQQLIDRFRNNG